MHGGYIIFPSESCLLEIDDLIFSTSFRSKISLVGVSIFPMTFHVMINLQKEAVLENMERGSLIVACVRVQYLSLAKFFLSK